MDMEEGQRLEREEALDRCYAEVFSGKVGEVVLNDLRYCCAYDEECIGKDDRETNIILGSRRVFCRIRKHIEDAENRKTSKNKQETYT